MNPTGSSIPMQTTNNTAGAAQFGNYSEWAQGEMAKGFTPQQLQQTLADSGVQIQQPQQQAPAARPAQQSGGGSWWHKLLPAAGGVLGGILGGAADVASLGALAPLINPITGAALGGAAGQAGENALEGKKVLQGNDLTSGIENSVGQAVGMGVGKVAGALGEGLVKAGSRAGEKTAQEAEAALAAKAPVNDATATQLNYGGVSSKLANELELGKGQQFVKNMGYDPTNPYYMHKVSNGVGVLNNVYDRALTAAPDVKMGDFNTTVFNSLKANGGTDLTTTPMGQALADFGKTSGVDLSAGVPETLPATQVRQLQQAVGRQIGNTQTVINNAELNGTYNVEAQSNLKTLQDLYSKLGTKLKTPGVNKAIQGFTVSPADRQGLITTYGDKLGNYLADAIDNGKSADDLLAPMQDLTKMGHASRLAINDIENVTNSPRAVARAKFQENGGVVPSKAATQTGPGGAGDVITAAAHATGHPAAALVAAANKAHQAGLTPAIARGVGNVIKRTAPLVAPATVAMSNIPTLAAETGQGGASAIPLQQGENMQPAAATGAPTQVNPVNSVLNNILWSLSQPGASLLPSYGSMVSGAQTLAPTVQQNELAANALSALPATYQNAGGAQGLGGGILSKVLAMVPGTAANTYQNQQAATAAQLAKVLGISPEAALAMLPQLAQTPGVAAPQQAATSGLVGQLTAGLPAAQ